VCSAPRPAVSPRPEMSMVLRVRTSPEPAPRPLAPCGRPGIDEVQDVVAGDAPAMPVPGSRRRRARSRRSACGRPRQERASGSTAISVRTSWRSAATATAEFARWWWSNRRRRGAATEQWWRWSSFDRSRGGCRCRGRCLDDWCRGGRRCRCSRSLCRGSRRWAEPESPMTAKRERHRRSLPQPRESPSTPPPPAKHFGVDLVGRHLEERLVLCDGVADIFQPADDGSLRNRLAELRHRDVSQRADPFQ